jgi:hypothetical protein
MTSQAVPRGREEAASISRRASFIRGCTRAAELRLAA